MRRLYLQIYLTVIGVLVLFWILVGIAWFARPDNPRDREVYVEMAAIVTEILPGPDAPPEEVEATLERFGTRFSSDLTLRNENGELIASHGRPLELPPGRIRQRERMQAVFDCAADQLTQRRRPFQKRMITMYMQMHRHTHSASAGTLALLFETAKTPRATTF